MNKEQNLNEPNTQQLNIAGVIGRFLCKIGIHKWEEGFSGSMLSPLADKCKRCKIVRIFHGWGYTYGRDANDL